jgi:antitoxin ParD1/3/4
MAVIALDTLAFTEELRAAGVPESQAKALSAVASEQLVTQVCLDARLNSHVPPASDLFADLRQAVQDGIDSGPAIPADQIFAELIARYASHHA